MEYISITLAIVAILISLWQGYLSKQQLDLANQTKSETEKLLEDIKSKVNKIELLTDETRKDVKEQVSKLIDKQDENMKTLLNTPAKSEQNQLIMQLLPELLKNPEALKTLSEIGKQ